MHGLVLLHNWLGKACGFIHRARQEALLKAVCSLLQGGRLTLTDLGRSAPGRALPKHAIKGMDRLLGNRHLHRERFGVYQALAKWLLSQSPRPVIRVDWSEVQPGNRFLLLKAALPFQGRALTVYEEVHPLKRYNNPRTHRRFLQRLSEVMPSHCRAIIVTDAGFRGPWFKAVERLGWDWVGRVRNRIQYSLEGQHWQPSHALYPSATPRVRFLGWGWLSKSQPYACGLYRVRKYLPRAGRSKQAQGRSAAAQRCRKMYKDPWLLATSLPHRRHLAKHLVKLYALRMQIELTFRDHKGLRWGWQLEYTGSHSTQRLEVLVLIGTLAMFITWLVGLAADARDWTRHVQVNTVRKRRVLSIVFLGRQLLNSSRLPLTKQALLDSMRQLPHLIAEQVKFVGIP